METDVLRSRHPRALRSAIALTALVLVSVLGIAVGSYVALLSFTEQLGNRSFQEGRARELAQTGLEEALWALNQNTWMGCGPLSSSAWTLSGTTRTITLSYPSIGNGATGQLVLTITNATSIGPIWPTITSQAQLTLTDGRVITKQLQSSTAPAPLFGNAIASTQDQVFFNSSGAIDSWNSDPDNTSATPPVAYSFTAGNPSNYAAVVAGKDVKLLRVQLSGYAATYGNDVSASVSGMPPGRVRGPATPASVNVDSTRLGRSAFIPSPTVFNVSVPTAPALPWLIQLLLNVLNIVDLLLQTVGLGIDLFQLPGDLDVNGITKPNLTIDRDITFIVEGNINISGIGKITITPTGSLVLIAKGGCTIDGLGIDNQTNDATKCVILATGSSGGSVDYKTSATYRGVIYSDTKPIEIRSSATLYGALLSNNEVKFTGGSPTLHYDLALRNARIPYVTTPYVLRQIAEY